LELLEGNRKDKGKPQKKKIAGKSPNNNHASSSSSKDASGRIMQKKRRPFKPVPLVDRQRQFFEACVGQSRLDLAMDYVESLAAPGTTAKRRQRDLTYQLLLSCCARLNAFRQARDVHRRQLELGVGSNAFAYSMLISVAGKLLFKANSKKKWNNKRERNKEGSSVLNENSSEENSFVEYIELYFEQSVRENCCNVVVCNAALDAYGRNGHCDKVYQLHQRMGKELDIKENTQTFNTLMQSASRSSDSSWLVRLNEERRRKGIEPTERTFSILLASVGKMQQRQEKSKKQKQVHGTEIEVKQAEDDSLSLAALLQHTGGVADWAFSMMDEMKEGEIEVNNHILSALFSACAVDGKGMKRCKALLFQYMEVGNAKTASSGGRGGKAKAAVAANVPNVNVWCSFIKLCSSCGQVDLAVEVVERHCQKPLSPYIRSALCAAIAGAVRKVDKEILDGALLNLTSEEESVTYHSKIENYCKKAIKWHNDAHKEYLMQVFMQQEDSDLAMQEGENSLERSKQLDSSNHPRHPDSKKEKDETVACNAVIHMCAMCGLVQQAFRAYVDMRRCNLLPDCTTFNSLIHCCSRANQPQRAIKSYEHMLSFGLAPDEVTYGVLMDLYANMHQPDQSMKLFIKMKQEGITPNIVHCTSLINAYGKAGTQDSVQKSFLIYKMMKMQGIKPTEVTLSCLIDACRRIYDVDRAFQYFVDICKEGILPGDATYSQFLEICVAHGRVDESLSLILKTVTEEVLSRKKRKETLDSLVIAMSNQKLVEKALDLHRRIEEYHEFGQWRISSEAKVSLCIACCKDGYSRDAYKLFEDVKEHATEREHEEEENGRLFKRQMSEVYSLLVQALGNGGQHRDMIEVSKACEEDGEQLDVAAQIAFVTACCNAQLLQQARASFLSLTQDQEGWIKVEKEEERMRLKAMFDTLIVSSCRGNMTEFALEAFDVWRSVTWELEKHDSNLGMGLRLSSVTLAFLESCCRKDESLEWRIFDVCAEMRRQQYNKKLVKEELSSHAPKISHHFDESIDEDDDEEESSFDVYGMEEDILSDNGEDDEEFDADVEYQDVIRDYE
jgi:pentatricopeptide repeat protein